MTRNKEKVTDLIEVATRPNVIFNNGDMNAEVLRINTEKHRTGGQQSAGGNMNAEGSRVNTEKHSSKWQQIYAVSRNMSCSHKIRKRRTQVMQHCLGYVLYRQSCRDLNSVKNNWIGVKTSWSSGLNARHPYFGNVLIYYLFYSIV